MQSLTVHQFVTTSRHSLCTTALWVILVLIACVYQSKFTTDESRLTFANTLSMSGICVTLLCAHVHSCNRLNLCFSTEGSCH